MRCIAMSLPKVNVRLLQLLLCLFHRVMVVRAIHPDVITDPKDLGFEVHPTVHPKVFYLIQPKAEGKIRAYLGPHESTHFYKMASVSVFLSTHLIFSHRIYTPPLYALCSIERSNLVAEKDTIFVCAFSFYSPFVNVVFPNASCVIHLMNQTECAAELDITLLTMKSSSRNRKIQIIVNYNVTAYQVKETTGELDYLEQLELTNSLIHKSYDLPPVTIIFQPDLTWSTLFENSEGSPLIEIGIPSLRKGNKIPILLAVATQAHIQEFKFRLLCNSTLRYRYERPIINGEARAWRVNVASKFYGAVVRVRKSKSHPVESENQTFGASVSGANRNVISQLLLEQVPRSKVKSIKTAWDEKFKGTDTDPSEFLHAQDTEERSEESSDPSGQPIIRIELFHLIPHSGSQPFRLLSLVAPQLIPQPGAMHMFVEFEPKDVIEPRWYPAALSPEPLKLRVVGLIPHPKAKLLEDAQKPSNAFASPSVGTLMDLTRHVFCRPAPLRTPGQHPIHISSSSDPSCSANMQRAPAELEELTFFQNNLLNSSQSGMLTYAAGGLGARFNWSDQLVLALGPPFGRNGFLSIVPSIYGPLYGHGDRNWFWRDWRGPTVRRWMLSGFRIHVSRQHLRRINAWHIQSPEFHDRTSLNVSTDYTGRFEQAQITVTSRIFTMRPGTGQKIYLGETSSARASKGHGSHTTSENNEAIKEFDITHLLPEWALVVLPVRDANGGNNQPPGAYIHYDRYTGRPHLVGRWPGRIMLGLVATLGDSQPLTSTYVDIGGREREDNRGLKVEETVNVVAIRAECVNPDLRLSGHLEPAAAGPSSFDNPLHGARDSFFPNTADPRATTDFSLPTPHRLTMELHVADSSDNSLVSAAASSAARSPEMLLSIFSQNWPTGKKPIGSSSSATCPIQLLAVSLIMSDESVLPAHHVPPNHLRISSLDSNVVWDPAIPMQPVMDAASKSSTPNVLVRVNSLIVWNPQSANSREGRPFSSIPLGAMDEVVAAVQSGHTLRDPGPPQLPSDWIIQPKEGVAERTEADSVADHKQIDGATGTYSMWSTTLGQNYPDSRTMLIASQNANKHGSLYSQLSGQGSRASGLITHILVWVGAITVLLVAVNCTVILALKKRRQTRALRTGQTAPGQQHYSVGSNSHERTRKSKLTGIGPIDIYNVEGNGCALKTNGSGEICTATSGSLLIPCSQLGYLPSYSDVHSAQLMMGSSSPPQVETMTAGLSCSSMGSTHSGPVGSLKHSLVMDSAVNPYIMLSDGSSFGAGQSNKISQPVNNAPPLSVSFLPMNYRSGAISNSPQSWNSPASMTPSVYPKSFSGVPAVQVANITSHSPAHLCSASLSPTNSGQCNPGNTSGLGSVGTCEGYSDEGIVSGFEMVSLSQEVVNVTGNTGANNIYPQFPASATAIVNRVATGSTNSTGSGGSVNGTRVTVPNRTHMSTFKQSPTIGAGSLSGGSSSAEINESRMHQTSESVKLTKTGKCQVSSGDPSSVDNVYTAHLSSSQFRASPKVPPSLRPSLMTESFTCGRTTEFGTSANYPERTASDVPNSAIRELGLRHHSSLRNNQSNPVTDNSSRYEMHVLPVPLETELKQNSNYDDELEDAPVPLPPALLLNNHGCLEALTEQSQTMGSTNLPNLSVLKLSVSPEAGISFGSYKRSDSFGMATKCHPTESILPFPNSTIDELRKNMSRDPTLCSHNDGSRVVGFGVHGEMVGDTLETSDEVSSGSKSSSAIHGESKVPKLPQYARSMMKNSNELTYSHSIPPPEL